MDESNSRKNQRINEVAIYTFARCEQLIADSARSAKILEDELAQRVAELILAQTHGSLLRPQDHMPALRRNGTGHDQPLEPVEVAGGAHRRTSRRIAKEEYDNLTRTELAAALKSQGLSTAQIARKMDINQATVRTYLAREGMAEIDNRHSLKGRKYKPGTHWTQQPKNRAKLAKVIADAHAAKVQKQAQ
jgi:DNA-binding CsgD family transcriptional regulator